MTKKDLIDTIIQSMPDNLTELEKARYIYIELGKQRRFDTKYYYGNARDRREAYRQAQIDRLSPKKLRDKRTIICVTLSEIYKSALQLVGINCEIVQDNYFGDKHVLPVVLLHDDKKGILRIKADLQQDLEAIQTGMSTVEFGTAKRYENDYDKISEDELKEIDQKIGFIQEDYRDSEIETIRNEIKGMDANESLKFILENPRIHQKTSFNGQVERRKYYRFILDTLIPYYTDKKVYIFSCYREREKSQETERKLERRDYTLCAYSYENDDINAYLYSEKEERFMPVTLEKLYELQNEGLVLGTKRKTKGVNLLKRFLLNNEKKRLEELEKRQEEREIEKE